MHILKKRKSLLNKFKKFELDKKKSDNVKGGYIYYDNQGNSYNGAWDYLTGQNIMDCIDDLIDC